MEYLKQSTAVTLKIGPFLDDTDGKTAETALTITSADVRLSKNGANIIPKGDASSCTHDEIGIYGCLLNTTDTANLGRLQLWVHETGALPVWHDFTVVSEEAYETLCGIDHWTVDLVVAMRGTDNAAPAMTALTNTMWTDTKAAFIDHSIATVDDNVDSVLADTNELQTNQSNWETATGFATENPPSQNLADYKATGFNTIVPDPAGTAPTAAEIDTELSGTHGAGSWLTSSVGAAPTVQEIDAELTSNHGASGWITATSVTVSDKTGFALSVAGVNAILDSVIEGTHTLRQYMRTMASVLIAKVSGGGSSTIIYRDVPDTKDRVTATVTPEGNRTNIVLDED